MASKFERTNSIKIERLLSIYGSLKDLQIPNKDAENQCLNEDVDEIDSKKFSVVLSQQTSIENENKKRSKRSGSFKELLFKIAKENERRNAPYFTIWIMTVEILLFLVMFTFYPQKNSPLFESNVTDIVWHQSNSFQEVTYSMPGNPWWGPSNQVLIHHGAVYTPCMKQLENDRKNILKARSEEDRSSCCLRLEYNTCCQALPEQCSNITSHLLRPLADRQATVCGMDPDFCDDHDKSSVKENISNWKPCKKRKVRSAWPLHTESYHMRCQILAKPCTYGIDQQCMFTTEEFCTFLRGTYHPEAFLCSQINPISDICGLFSSKIPGVQPKQYIRLFISLFMHAGVIHLLISLYFQWNYLRHFEEGVGTFNIILVHFISGIMSNMASALFLPRIPDIGPNGASFGTYSFFYYYFIKNWHRYKTPLRSFLTNNIHLMMLFFLGAVLPWINNFANITGFISGLLLMFVLAPGKKNECFRTLSSIISTILLIFFFCLLLYKLFWGEEFSENFLKNIQHFNCLFGENWCRIKNDISIHVNRLSVRV